METAHSEKKAIISELLEDVRLLGEELAGLGCGPRPLSDAELLVEALLMVGRMWARLLMWFREWIDEHVRCN